MRHRASGRLIPAHSTSQFADPVACAVVGSLLAISDNGNHRIQLLNTPDGTYNSSLSLGAYDAYAVAAAADGTLFYASGDYFKDENDVIMVRTDQEITQASADGTFIASTRGLQGSTIQPLGMVVQPPNGAPEGIVTVNALYPSTAYGLLFYQRAL